MSWLLFLMTLLVSFPCRGGPLADLDGDGRIDANDVFVFASLWMTDSATADLIGDGIVDDHDLLELVRQFHLRMLVPTPTPAGLLPAPVWTHPALEDMWKYFYTEDGQEDDFLDWSDVPGAGAYEVRADITLEHSQTPFQTTWFVEATQTPGVPVSNSKVHHYHSSTDLVVVRVRALNPDPAPTPGYLSDERAFYLSLQVRPSSTPTPTIEPTVDIDFNGDEVTNKLDILYLQKSWLTRLGQHTHYDPAVAVLAEPTTEVDGKDVLAFQQEYGRQRIPIPAPVLVSPASGAIVSYTTFMIDGMTFDWEPVPEVRGGVKYTLIVTGPYIGDPVQDYPLPPVLESEYTSAYGDFIPIAPPTGRPLTEYRWTVQAESIYGIKIPSQLPLRRRVLYVQQG